MKRTRLVLVGCLVLLTGIVPVEAGAEVEPITGTGVVHAGIYSTEWNIEDDLNALAVATGGRVTFAGLFMPVTTNEYNTYWQLESSWQAQSTPFVNLTISDTAAAIAGGDHDADIATWAGHLETWLDDSGGRSVIIAPLQEMNGDWTPYGVDPANYANAYKRMRSIVKANVGDPTKIRWAFAPNGWSTPGYGGIAAYYPGNAVVDLIGISAYNFGDAFPNGWETVDETYTPWLDELRSFAPGKPYMISQTGTSSFAGDKDAWLIDMFNYTASDPNVVGFVYFNFILETDWEVWNNPTAVPGFATGMTLPATKHQWPLDNWFQPGPLPFSLGDSPCPATGDCDQIALVNTDSAFFLYDDLVPDAGIGSFYYGAPGDVALMGDWDCDGVDTPAMYRPSNGFMYLRNTNTAGFADDEFFYGIAGDIPIAGDWDGDGCDTLAIYRAPEAKVYIRNELGTGPAEHEYFYGVTGDAPFGGDFDGDGKDTVGLYRESTGFVYFRNTLTTGVADFDFFYGAPGDRIMAGDWDGDGDDTVGIYRPSDGNVYLRFSNTQGEADHVLAVGLGYNAALVAG